MTVTPPEIFSRPRITTLVASLFVSFGAGTNYAYSAWAPQLGSQLRITHTQLNIVGLAGNVGVYTFGPIWGRVVDKRGPLIPLIGGFILLLTGYSGIKLFFDAGVPEGAATISTFTFCLIVFCNFMTGAGGNGGLVSAVNSTARSFPDKARATTTGLVISGFGLSAFIFSAIAHVVYAGNTSAFLQLLAFGTALPMVVGCFLVRQIPLPSSESTTSSERGIGGLGQAVTSTSALIDDSDVRLLDREDSDVEMDEPEVLPHEYIHGDPRSRSMSLASSASGFARSSRGQTDDDLPNIFGAELWKSGDFWLLFTMLSILAGTGLMYINNVGAMSQTLYARQSSHYDEVEAGRWQATQVSTISVMSFLGRIIIGIISDTAKNTFKFPRSYCLGLVSTGIFLSQVIAARINDVRSLWVASAMLGISYGSTFSLFPQVSIEWFGLPHFSENWGYLSMSPMVAGNIFMMFFGRNLDAHETKSHSQTASARIMDRALNHRAVFSTSSVKALMRNAAAIPSSGDMPQCREGKECYVAALHLTTFMTFACILLSIWAGMRDRQNLRRIADGGKRSGSRRRSGRVSMERT